MTEHIPLSRPTVGSQELAAVEEVLASGWLAGQGPQCTALENGFMEMTGRRHAVAVANCTAGLHLALLALGVGQGDEVLVADYSYPATAHAVLHCGAVPRFVDVDPATGCMDPALVPQLLTPRTRALVAVDALGMPADWSRISEVAAAHGLAVVADAACSVGAERDGSPAGSRGDVAVFSLHARKGITSGEGGVVVTDDEELAETIRAASCFGVESALVRSGRERFRPARFVSSGYNYKLSDILAAIGRVQLGRLPELLAERRRLASAYDRLLVGVEDVAAPREPLGSRSAWQTYAVTLASGRDRDAVVQGLRAHGVESTIGTFSQSRQPVFGSQDQCPVSWGLADRHLALPFFVGLSDGDQVKVVDALSRVLTTAS